MTQATAGNDQRSTNKHYLHSKKTEYIKLMVALFNFEILKIFHLNTFQATSRIFMKKDKTTDVNVNYYSLYFCEGLYAFLIF